MYQPCLTSLARAHQLSQTAICRCLSSAATLDKRVLEFFENEAEESLPKKCLQMRKTSTAKVISKMLKSVQTDAGVLVPICIVENRPSLLYTVRSRNLRSHAGEVSFPGGKKDESDNSIVDVALREAEEEISISKDSVKVLTSFGPFTSRRLSVSITAVFAFMGQLDLSKVVHNHNEVSEVFTVPITDLVAEKRDRYTQFRNGWCMPVFLAKNYHIWGITANITDILLSMITPLNYNHKFEFKGRDFRNLYVTKGNRRQ